MPSITFSGKGSFKKTDLFFDKAKHILKLSDFDRYGKIGVEALSANTPKDTGLLSESWYYEVSYTRNGAILQFCNKDIENNRPIAILVQYGHATKNGSWVEGREFINEALQPVFDKIAESIWADLTN